jgi:ADP-ribose pyrophosphatase YjhB (NUDIX family)
MLIPLVNTDLEPAPFVGFRALRRGEEPGKGELALPGGHLEAWETWQQGSAREVREEIKIDMSDDEVELFNVISTQNNYLIVFSTCKPRSQDILETFVANHEVQELVILKKPTELIFPSHTQALEEFFQRNKGKVRW